MLNLRPFQIILIAIFVGLGIGGVIMFASFENVLKKETAYGDRVEIWGVLDQGVFIRHFANISTNDPDFKAVQYIQKDERTFEDELINAIAEGRGPDVIVLSHDQIIRQRNKLTEIPFEVVSERTFRDLYIDGTEIFLSANGSYALPFAVDPLVMYWNRDLFASSGLANPPRTWEELVARTTPALTERTFSSSITRSAIAFGEYDNVFNAKEVLSMLLFQSGSKIVEVEDDNDLTAALSRGDDARSALRFYTDFSNPTKKVYSWDRSQPLDREAFLSGDLGLYFGFGSEYEEIRDGNPNLNFDVTVVPQGQGAVLRKGFGTFYGLAVLRSSDNFNGALNALFTLSGRESVESLTGSLGLASTHRETIATGSTDPLAEVLYRSALVSAAWLDPNPRESATIFSELIDDIVSGRSEMSKAISDASTRLNALIRSSE